jgi:peroxiredoxin
MKTKISLFTTLALTALCTGALFAAEAPHVGAPAPGFSLTDSNGKAHSLGQYKGKYVVLEWFNPGCPFVQKHYKSENMQKLQKEFTGKDVVWLTIDSSAPGKEGNMSPAEANKQISDWKISSTAFLLDPDGKVGHEYGATNTPHMYVINPEGKLIYSGAIDSKPTANPDDIASATNYVKTALDEAMAGQPVQTPTSRAYGCSIKYDR